MSADLKALLDASLNSHIAAIEACAQQHSAAIIRAASALAKAFAAGNKVLVFGNGGSACDAMHFAGECVGRFVSDRRPLPALALTADSGIITAIGNDYGFDAIFSRQVRAHAQAGDMCIAISTSGQSPNVLEALKVAGELGLHRVLLTGGKGKDVTLAEEVIAVPSLITAHIQECHIWILQLMIAMVEKKLFDLQ